MTKPLPPLRILHLHAEPGDSQARVVQLINAFGQGCAHTIVADATAATSGIDRGITVDRDIDFPALSGPRRPGRLQRLARAMQGHDLVLTYGYGAIDAALAHTLLRGQLLLPPLVHHENMVGTPKAMQNWVRRVALGRAAALIVPSPRLEAVAMADWHQPRWRVKRIAPGVRTAAYANPPRRDALPRVIKRAGELWLGIVAEPTPAIDLTQLVQIMATLPVPWQLVILGEHRQRNAIRDEALRLDLSHRVHWPGAVAEPDQMIGLFDLLVVAPDREQSPIPIIQAMAAGLTIAASDGGDVAALLAPENRPFVVAFADQAGLAVAIRALAEAPALRAQLGAANRALARTAYDETAMVAAYRAAYAAALGRDRFP